MDKKYYFQQICFSDFLWPFPAICPALHFLSMTHFSSISLDIRVVKEHNLICGENMEIKIS